MIGSGVFLLPATLAAIGSSTIIGWIIASAGAMLLAGVFALLAIAQAHARRTSWTTRRKGCSPFFGFANWLLYWLSCWVGVAGHRAGGDRLSVVLHPRPFRAADLESGPPSASSG
jgi:amino acid transporter